MSREEATMTALVEARKTLPPEPLRRSFPAKYQTRALTGSKVEVSGYASTVEQPYEMYDMFGAYTEVVRAGAFAKTLGQKANVAFLANHEGLTLARTGSGTLSLDEDEHGLLAVATLNTARTDARDLVAAIEDGDVEEMSFAFLVVRQQWSPDYDERALVELNLNRGDVSAVNFGANPTTNIGLRSFRTERAAQLHRAAQELRAGKTLSTATMETLAQVLDLIASADDAVDQAQPLLADLMGVSNPDDDDMQQNAAHLDLLRRREEHERSKPAFRITA